MAVAADASVFVSGAAAGVVAGGLALEHLRVSGDAVAVALRDLVVGTIGLVLCRRPGQVISAHLDVVVGELAELVVVHAEEFGLLAGAQVQARDLVDDEGNCRAHAERPGGRCGDVGDLHVQLLPVVLDPAAVDGAGVYAIQADDVGCGEDAVEEEADHAGDSVLGKHIHGVVNLDPELDCLVVSLDELNCEALQETYSWLQNCIRCQ